MGADAAWATSANCRGGDPERLFVTGAAQREARKICRGCPVLTQCLAKALDEQLEFGVWGGKTERERRAILKQRPDVSCWSTFLASQTRRAATVTQLPRMQPAAALVEAA
ncbi:WhiB family transcriptional regulator [Pseudonocardia spinosispora]|uniref:WhiB family transcriptional regulator n=1 Tax=Pseudonocardia spinosispora TaxID=103441 RepID=UPI000408CA6D|nr:WhiB family transcriptional regulator [Pseudonocardia spinosispora]